MLFYSFFKTQVGKQVTVELKNDLQITGTLVSVDQYLCIKLDNVKVKQIEEYPQLCSIKNCFIRGSVLRYIHLPSDVDLEVLRDATRKEAALEG